MERFEVPRVIREPERPRPKVAVEVAEVLSVPLFPYMTPESAPRIGAVVKVCVPPQVFEVEVPNARESTLFVFCIG